MKKAKDAMNAFLGEGTEFEGKLSFTGTVRIDGRFRGEIFSEGTLIIGNSGTIEADITIGQIVISGEVKGNILASERVEIHAPGKVFGSIESPAITIDEGVIFEGSCKMTGPIGNLENKAGGIAQDISKKEGDEPKNKKKF